MRKQVDPAPPQFVGERTSHVVPMQQPSGQDVASHTQLEPVQRCPSLHSAPPAHVQAPVALHPSALDESHGAQLDPWAPQVLAVEGTQALPLQHPMQTPQLEQAPSQISPGAHCAHFVPSRPHRSVVVPGWHVAPSQQPTGHEVASQTHSPWTHRCPAPQTAFAPQKQPPMVSHESLVVRSQPLQTHAPLTHVCPGWQGSPVPQAAPRLW